MTRTFVDSGVLIAGARGSAAASERSLAVLSDQERVYLSSDLVRLEVLPRSLFHRQVAETGFFLDFFQSATDWATLDATLNRHAFDLAKQWNLGAVDTLHVAAAIQLDADEFITTERPTSPLVQVRVGMLRVISLR